DRRLVEADELDAADPGGVGLGADDDGGVGGDAGQEEARLVEHVLQGVVGGGEEAGHLLAGPGLELLLAGQVVDEVAVPRVGRHPPRRGVGVGDVALPLEDGHLVADGGAGDAQPRLAGDRAGAHRLAGLDVLLDERLEDGGLAFVHGSPRILSIRPWAAACPPEGQAEVWAPRRRAVASLARRRPAGVSTTRPPRRAARPSDTSPSAAGPAGTPWRGRSASMAASSWRAGPSRTSWPPSA